MPEGTTKQPYFYEPWAVKVNGWTEARFANKKDALVFADLKLEHGCSTRVEIAYEEG